MSHRGCDIFIFALDIMDCKLTWVCFRFFKLESFSYFSIDSLLLKKKKGFPFHFFVRSTFPLVVFWRFPAAGNTLGLINRCLIKNEEE